MEISIVIPIYKVTKNATENLPMVIELLRSKYKDFELLFIIDNVDVDKQIKELVILKEEYKEIKIYDLKRNYGQHFATLCGYYHAKGDFIVCIDEDMTKYITEVCKTDAYKKHDVFYFHYNKNEMYNSPVRKFFSNAYKNVIINIVNLREHSTFRIISKDLRDKILLDKHVFWNLDIMIFNNTKRIGKTDIHIPDITDSDTAYNYKKLSRIAFEIAYEHNTLFMNMLFPLFVAVPVYLVFVNATFAVLIYILLVLTMNLYFILKKKYTDTTQIKILNALQN